MSFLSARYGEPRLEKVHREFQGLFSTLKKINDRNNLLLRQAQDVISFLRTALYSALDQPLRYDKQGNIEGIKGGYFEGEI